MQAHRWKLHHDGYVVIENFLLPQECDEMVEAANDLTEQLPEKEDRAIFSSSEGEKQQMQDDYFISSNDKIRAFFELDAMDEDGNLIVDPRQSLNKIGHALHLLHPIFRVYTYCERVLKVVKALGFEKPAVVQSMILYKNPKIGSEVMPHQDASYLYTEPIPVMAFWIALEDATIENGCLWVSRGSHKSGIHRRLVRNPDVNSPKKLMYDRTQPIYPFSTFRPVPVKKGSCVLLHGNVVHMSKSNTSEKSRLAYSFHVIEMVKNKYFDDNWLKEGPEAPFQNMFTTPQIK